MVTKDRWRNGGWQGSADPQCVWCWELALHKLDYLP